MLTFLFTIGTPDHSPPQAKEPTVIRTLLGDVALELRTTGDGTLSIGAAGVLRSLALDVRATDARRWADSAARLLEPYRRRTGRSRRAAPDEIVHARVVLEEPGIGAGSFVLARVDSAATRSWVLFASDAEYDGVRQPLESEDASTLIKLVKRAALAAMPRSARPRKLPPRQRPKAPVKAQVTR